MKIAKKTKKYYNNKRQNGFILLITVIVLGVVGIAVTVSLLLLGIGMTKSNFSWESAQIAKGMANTCAEEGLNNLQANVNYTGTGSVTIGSNSCSFTVTNTGGTTRSVSASATVRGSTRRVNVTVSAVTPKITVSQWAEVAN
jgi:hypothetical protein